MRQPGVHAAGIVIAPEPLVNYCPLQTVDRNTGHKSTQFDMKAVESIGLIKIDILGLTALSIMHNCLDSIKVNYNKEINLKEIPKDDSSIYEMLSNGNSAGVFQMETRNMTKLAQEIKVSSFNKLRDLVAFRPGVLDAKQDKIYKYNKFNPDKYKPIHPKLGNILKQTHGILLFQESYQQAAVDLAGFSLSDGALLIRAIGKKIKDLMANMEAKWISGCEKNGLTKQEAKSIFATFHAAGNYAFNMAHSVGYATLAYQTAYLKYYYPLLYMTSLLNSEKDNHDKFMLYCQDLVKLGINLISPNINKSNSDFSANIEKNEIRYGLSAIKNVGEKAAKHIEQIRGNREFISVYDFMDRIDSSIVNKSCILALAKTGCFEEIGNISRETIVNNIDTIINFYRKAKCNYTNSLFKIKPIIKESERINPYIIRQWEQELMGTSF